jgi:hypothetical protein
VKAVPLFALALSVLLIGLAIQPAAALNPAFPADHDTLTYDIHGTIDIYYLNGTHASYPLQMTLTHTIVNHTGYYYFANLSISITQPADYLGLNASHPSNDIWFPLVHYYKDNGETRLLYTSVNPANWSQFSDNFIYDFFFIPKQATPGETVYWCLSGDSDSWTEIGFPIGLGANHVVGPVSLSTVGMAFSMNYVYNGTVTASTDTLSRAMSVEVYWEWSLGFLTKLHFDSTEDVNPDYSGNHGATQVDITATMSLTSFSLADVPIPYIPTTTTLPPIPGFPMAAVLVGLLVALVPLAIIRKRRQ